MRDAEVRDRVARVEQLVSGIEDDEPALDALQAVVELYGEGLRRLVEGGPETFEQDELVAHLLMLHDLHPVPVETRVAEALERVRPYLGSHGGGVELLGVQDGVARLRLSGTCDGCPSSTITLRRSIEAAILDAAPEVERVEAEQPEQPEQPLLQIARAAPGPCLSEAAT